MKDFIFSKPSLLSDEEVQEHLTELYAQRKGVSTDEIVGVMLNGADLKRLDAFSTATIQLAIKEVERLFAGRTETAASALARLSLAASILSMPLKLYTQFVRDTTPEAQRIAALGLIAKGIETSETLMQAIEELVKGGGHDKPTDQG